MFFIIASTLNILNTFLYNYKIVNLKIFFCNGIDFQIADYNFINKYTIYQFNKYATINFKDKNF